MYCNRINLSEHDINTINIILKKFKDSPMLYSKFITTKYPNLAESLLKIISDKKTKEGDQFPLPLDLTEDVPTELDVQPTQVMQTEMFAADDIVEINYNGDKNGINRMFRTFSDAMVEAAIYNKNKKRSVQPNAMAKDKSFRNALNENLFEFKQRMMNAICAFTKTTYQKTYTTPAHFEKQLQLVMSTFYSKLISPALTERERNSEIFQRALDAFTILKNFDKLLNQTTPFIKVRKGFENTQDKNRYEYTGADVKLFKTWTTKEEVSIDDQISDLTGILLNYFPECRIDGSEIEGTTISKPGFYQVAAAFKNWINTTSLTNIEKTEDEAVVTLYRLYNGDLDVLRNIFLKFANTVGESGFSKHKLYGIKKMLLESDLDQEISKMFWNLMFKTEKNIIKTTSVFNRSVSNRLLQDNYKTIQLYKIQDAVATACDRFKYFEVDRWTSLQNTFGIEPDANSHNSIILFKGTNYETKITVKSNNGVYYIESKLNASSVVQSRPEFAQEYDEKVKKFIESFLDVRVPDNFREIINQISGNSSQFKTLFDIYGDTLGITIFLINGGLDDVFENNGNQLQEQLKWRKINRNFDALQEFLGVADGTDMTSTLRNQHGNNVAAYTLTSLAYNLPKLYLMLENQASTLKKTGRSNIFRGNIVYENIRKIGNPTIRGDFDIYGKKKNARDLNDAEIQHVALMADFWHNFVENDFIELQNDVFSDKNTHFSFQYHKSIALGSYTLGEAIDDIMTGKAKGKNTFEDAIFSSRRASHQAILNNLILDFYEAELIDSKAKFLKDGILIKNWKDSKYDAIKVDAVKTVLTSFSPELIAKKFKDKNIDYIEELHDKVNETLFRGFDVYLLDSSKILFKNRLQREKETALELLIKSGLIISGDLDQAGIAQITSKIGSDWVDSISGDLLLYKQSENGIIINPLIEAYFYSDILFSNSINELLFGKTFFHPNKYSAKPFDPESVDNDIDENGNFTEGYYLRSEASRKSAANKRTVIAGATIHPFFHKKYGTQSKIKMAVVKDLPATVFTMMGIQNSKLDSMDGSILVSPYQDNFENASLLDAKVGHDKKTIFGSNDSKYGMPTLLKMAAFSLTNDRRRMSICSEVSAESLFKKMHNEQIDASKLKFAKYYGEGTYPDRKENIDNIKENNPIYIDDYENGTYWRIDNLQMIVEKGTPMAQFTLSETDNTGKPTGHVESNMLKPINSIYDLDQLFGGAFAMQFDERTKRLEYSDVNIKVVSNIICNEKWKSKFISYVTNKSAIKVGARNVNDHKVFLSDNDDPLLYTEMDISFGGVQMDADHLLQDSDVTEMSQMISSLIQNGFFTDDVLSIYEEIGKIVTDSLSVDLKLMKSEDFAKTHQKLGKELIETFAKGNEETMGLAQSYLIKAAKELAAGNENIKIPFSDPTLHGKFIATLVSNINKKGIKRKYAGIAAVLVPSRSMIQHFTLNGVNYTFRDLCKYLKNNGYTYTAKEYITESKYNPLTDTYDNPFIVKLTDKRNIDFGDTILYKGDVIKVDNWDVYDELRNTNKYKTSDLHVWTIKPRDLRQSDTTFTTLRTKYSIYDLNSVRASHYFRQLITDNKGKTLKEVKINFADKQQVAKWKLIESVVGRNILQSDTLDPNFLSEISKKISDIIKEDVYNIDKNGSVSITSIPGNAHRNPRTWMYESAEKPSELFNFDPNWTIQERVKVMLDSDKKSINDIYEYGDVTLLDKLAFNYAIDSSEENVQQLIKDLVGLYFLNQENETIDVVEWIQNSIKSINIPIDEESIEKIINDTLEEQKTKYLTVSNVQTRFAEIMMGRAFAEELGLQKGDSIGEIKQLKEQFFLDRIKSESKFPLDDDTLAIKKEKYDMMLCGANGEKLLVVLSKNNEKQFEGLYPSKVYENRNGIIYYNGKEFCEQGNKQFYSKPARNGTEYQLVFVDNLSEVDELMDSNMFRIVRYNYASENTSEIFYQQYKNYIDENGLLTNELYINYKIPFVNSNGTTYKKDTLMFEAGVPVSVVFNNAYIKTYLQDNEEFAYNYRVTQVANHMYTAFEKSLLCIGARIPTQSMQSFMGMEIVGFTESDVNEVYVPAIQTFLQGSDYDIDKLYIMMYDISKNGKLRTFSRLQGSYETIDQVFELTSPTGVKFDESPDGKKGIIINSTEAWNAVNLTDVSAFNKVINSNTQYIVFNTRNKDLKNKFLNMINKHNSGKLKGSAKESALKNMIVHRIQKLLKQPLSQIPAHAPITMDTFQAIASQSVLGKLETRLTSDNPFSKFTMQVQNMVGKDVIGVTAVGMKVFFATTTFINKRVQDVIELLNLRKDPNFEETDEYVSQIRSCLKDIFFEEINLFTKNSDLVTLANINLIPLINVLSNNDYSLPINYTAKFATKLDGAIPSLLDVVKDAFDRSQTIDAAEGISQLLSCATDNAKELILAKINATVDFADAWSYLMTSGWTVKEISDLMMHPIFNIVTQYSKSDIFSTIVSSSNPEKAVNFVLGESHLSGIDLAGLKLIMGQKPKTNVPYDNECFIHKLLYVTDENGKIITDGSGIPRLRSKQYITKEQLDEAFTKGSDFRATLLSLINSAMRNGSYNPEFPLEISKILKQHLQYLWEIKKNDGSVSFDEWEEETSQMNNEEWESSYEDGFNDEYTELDVDLEADTYEKRINTNDFDPDDTFNITANRVRNLYKYLTYYVVPKNESVVTMSYNDYDKLKHFKDHILPGVKEQQINGSNLGVNQGLKTNDYEFYSKLKRTENFINEKCLPVLQSIQKQSSLYDPIQNLTSFDILRSLRDEEYRKQWEDIYEFVKSKTNVIRLIHNVPNFAAMFELNTLAHHQMEHSIWSKLNMRFEKELMRDLPIQKLNEEEWKVMSKFSRDVLLRSWLYSRNIEFNLPMIIDETGTESYFPCWEDGTYISKELAKNKPVSEPIMLNNDDASATFVRLFESWIVPTLKDSFPNNAFLRNLSTGCKFSRTYNQKMRHKRLSLNAMMADASPKNKAEYAEILKSFNAIADHTIPELGNLMVKDILFIYNTIVYKNAFTENGFTRLMETISLTDPTSLVSDYSEFLASLDAGEINIDAVFNDDGSFSFGPISGNMTDLLYRLSFTKNASMKFGVTHTTDNKGAINGLQYVDMYGKQIEGRDSIPIANPDANDYCWEMNVDAKLTGEKATSEGLGTGLRKLFGYDSKEVIVAVTDGIIQRFNLNDSVIKINNNDIRKALIGENEELNFSVRELNRIKKAKAFIHNGRIYLNMDRITGDTLIHELMHLICASAKFHENPMIKQTYYNLLTKANQYIKSNPELNAKMHKLYSGDYASDFKEECLVHLLAESFAISFKNNFGKIQFLTDINDYVQKVLTDALKITFNGDVDQNRLGNSAIGDIMLLFSSKLLNKEANQVSATNVVLSQQMKTLKRILINAADNGKNSYIKYNC